MTDANPIVLKVTPDGPPNDCFKVLDFTLSTNDIQMITPTPSIGLTNTASIPSDHVLDGITPF